MKIEIELTAVNNEAHRLERLLELFAIIGPIPGLRGLHDHKGNLTASWEALPFNREEDPSMRKISEAWRKLGEYTIVEHVFWKDE